MEIQQRARVDPKKEFISIAFHGLHEKKHSLHCKKNAGVKEKQKIPFF